MSSIYAPYMLHTCRMKHRILVVSALWAAGVPSLLALLTEPRRIAFHRGRLATCSEQHQNQWKEPPLPLQSTTNNGIERETAFPFLLEAIDQSSTNLSETQRIFHGRGGCFPGCENLSLDWYPPVWVLTSFEELTPNELEGIHKALERRWSQQEREETLTPDESDCQDKPPFTWVYQSRIGNNVSTTVMAGQLPDPHIVQEQGCRYAIKLETNRNTGLFLDMANGRQWVRENARGAQVLNLFAYTCSFSIAALQGGATSVVNIDMAPGALKSGQRNHELNGVAERARFLSHDIFKTWGKLKKLGPYDLIIVDPPSYQKGSFVAKNDYIKIIRRLPSLLRACEPGQSTAKAKVLLCLNAPELDTEFLHELVSQAAPELGFVERIENPASFPSLSPERALKVLLYEMTPGSIQ